jgi:hypothetical protein
MMVKSNELNLRLINANSSSRCGLSPPELFNLSCWSLFVFQPRSSLSVIELDD